jgi:hypothetical protein
VAKKSRTPAPPRKVQAPQRRTDPKKPSRLAAAPGKLATRRNALLLGGLAAVVVIAAVIAAVVVVTGGKGSAAPPLVGLQVGSAPWNPGLDTLPDRVSPLGLHELAGEAQVLHIHQHLDIFVNGTQEPVPANIGIYDGQFLTELHTHDPTGIMHVESPTRVNFDLGQFFGVWGVRLTGDCVGGYCRNVTPWSVYVNGQSYSGDPSALVLKEHQEIVFVIGTPPKKIPSSYKFPVGL